MRKMMACAVVLVVALGMLPAGAQEKDEAKTAHSASAQPKQPLHYYRLEFVFRELQDKKVINTRYYAMIIADNAVLTSMKSGARLPVSTGAGGWQYVDVGVSLKCRVRAEDETPMLVATVDFTSPAMPEQGAGTPMMKEQPVLRTANADIYAPLVSGKSMIVAAMDDPSLPRRFEIEVTPTRLK